MRAIDAKLLLDEPPPKWAEEHMREQYALIEQLQKAVAAERERCAKIAETLSKVDPHGPRLALEIAAQIRRGE